MKTEIELEDLATVSARIHRGEPEERVLYELGIDPSAWPSARDGWLERIARRAEAGNLALAQRYVTLYAAATTALTARPKTATTTREALSTAASQTHPSGHLENGDRRVERPLVAPGTAAAPAAPPPPEPTLSLYEYAMLRAEIAYTTTDEARVWNKYGLSAQSQQETELAAWERKIRLSQEISREYRSLYADAQRHWSRLARK